MANVRDSKYHTENWLKDDQRANEDYYDYWNNEEEEKTKEWYILDNNFEKMEQMLDREGQLRDLKQCVDVLRNRHHRTLKGTGIDLAAGNLWAVPHLFRLADIQKLYCLEYSEHRLLKIGPKVLEHYQVPQDRIVLVLGSFYNLHLPDNSMDFALLSSAFHHADRPEQLLAQMRRVLKPHAMAIIIGEERVNLPKAYLKNAAKYFLGRLLPNSLQERMWGKRLRSAPLFSSARAILPPEPILGDHYYADFEYRQMFGKFGFGISQIPGSTPKQQCFILENGK